MITLYVVRPHAVPAVWGFFYFFRFVFQVFLSILCLASLGTWQLQNAIFAVIPAKARIQHKGTEPAVE
jgi:hypothetical protein